jgi:serine phosphatase RsbU (regulator of sigma subunit)
MIKLCHLISMLMIWVGIPPKAALGTAAGAEAALFPDTPKVEIFIPQEGHADPLTATEGSWQSSHKAQRTIDCHHTYRGRLTLENSTPSSIDVVILDRWLLTSQLQFYFRDRMGRDVTVPASHKSYAEAFAIPVRHLMWHAPVGRHTLTFQYQCHLRGYPMIEVMTQNQFASFSSLAGIVWTFFCMTLFVAAVYGLVIYLFSRQRIFLALGGVCLTTFLTFFLFIRIESRTAFYLPNIMTVDFRTFLIFLGFNIMATAYFIRTRLYDIGATRSFVYHMVMPASCIAPFIPFMPYAVELMFTYFAASPLLLVMVTATFLRVGLWLDAVGIAIMLLTHLYGTMGLHHEAATESHMFEMILVGYYVMLMIILVNLGRHGLAVYQTRKALQLQSTEDRLSMATAVELQNRLMFGTAPSQDFASILRPAESIGGDWYSYFFDGTCRYVHILLGDVTGHGTPSAYTTAVVWGALKTIRDRLQHATQPPAERMVWAVNLLNEIVFKSCARYERAMTTVMVTIDLKEGKGYYFNGGHNSILHRTKDKTRVILAPGEILGMNLDITPEIHEFQVETGDMLFFYTDGLIENEGPDGQRVKLREVSRALAAETSAQSACRRILDMSEKKWGARALHDDVTILVYQVQKYANEESEDTPQYAYPLNGKKVDL